MTEGSMTLPSCSLCRKAGSGCIYPTSRKPRRPRHQKQLIQQLAQSYLEEGVDYISNLSNEGNDADDIGKGGQEDAQPQQTTGEVYNRRNSDPHQNNVDDLAFSDGGPRLLDNLAAEQMSLASQSSFVNAGFLGLFGDLDHTAFTADTFSDGWQTQNLSPRGLSASGDMVASNLDCFLDMSNGQDRRNPRLELPEVPLTHPTSSTEVAVEVPEELTCELEIAVAPQLINELIEVYFEKIHSFLPLFHKSRFVEAYATSNVSSDRRYPTLPWENSFILNGVLSLSARFSSSTFFNGIPPTQRGERFAEKAKALYDDSIRTFRKPTLQYLQGCILLAFYLYSSEPDSQGWLLIGACSRLAYDLGLDKIDEASLSDNQPQALSCIEWSQREELRRAWWCVWELDTFASAIACRPPTINRTKMHVCLPVSDETWFADVIVDSAIIDPDPLHTWHTLRDCPNQDERAWFLVINLLLLEAQDMVQQKRPKSEQIVDLENAIACYALLLPPHFQLSSGSLKFDSKNFRKMNWILSTNMMLQGCRTFYNS